MDRIAFDCSSEFVDRFRRYVSVVHHGDYTMVAAYAGMTERTITSLLNGEFREGEKILINPLFFSCCAVTEEWLRDGDGGLMSPALKLRPFAEGVVEVFLRAGNMTRGDIMSTDQYNALRDGGQNFTDRFWKLWHNIGNTSFWERGREPQ